VADSAWAWAEVTGDFEPVKRLLPNLVTNYEAWERERFDPQVGLFWQLADSDGMEGPIGGHGYRPTINAYMYGDALAIARISDLCGRADWAADYRKKAADLKRLVQHRLWNPDQEFFEVHEAIGSMGLLGWRINRDIQSTKRATPSASVRADTKALASLNSGSEPARSWDGSAPQLRFPGRMGTKEWVQYDFPEALTISNLQVYLLGGHLMDLPQSFRVFSRKNGQWQSLEKVKGRIDQKNRWNELTFDALKADGLRLEFSLKGFDRTALGLRNVRELLGFVPWCFNLPDSQYSIAWRQLNDPQGFAAPWGLTTAEQRHPEFQIRYDGHHCLWNGPVWPFATTQTLVALANLLNNYQQDVVGKRAYFDALITYARSHRMILPDGKIIPWIDEDQHPYTGEWVARSILARNPKAIPDRGKDYNHSGFCDLVISGLVGLRPQAGQEIVLNPLLPENTWNYFCLDRVPYHGHTLTILYDKSGKQYKRGVGLRVFEGDRLIAASPTLARLEGRLNP
jgi:hypothetical protein